MGCAHKIKTGHPATKVVQMLIQQPLGWLCCQMGHKGVSSAFGSSGVAVFDSTSVIDLGSPGLVTEPSPTTAPRTPSTDDASKSPTIFLQLSPRSPCMAASPTYPAPEHQGESGSPQSHLTRPTYSGQPSPDYPPRTRECSVLCVKEYSAYLRMSALLENNSVGSLVQDQQAESQPVLQGTTSSLGVQLQSVTTISENTGGMSCQFYVPV